MKIKINYNERTTANISKLGVSGNLTMKTKIKNRNGLKSLELEIPSLLIFANRYKPFNHMRQMKKRL